MVAHHDTDPYTLWFPALSIVSSRLLGASTTPRLEPFEESDFLHSDAASIVSSSCEPIQRRDLYPLTSYTVSLYTL